MHFYLIVALQGFCLYHLYKNRNAYYWVFLIIFIPVIGSIIYLVTQVYNKRDAEKITNEIATIINPTKKVKDLEQKLQFSDTFQNRVNLAEGYFEIKDYNNAKNEYLTSLEDNFENDFFVISQLIECFFLLEDYEKAIEYSNKIKEKIDFDKSRAQFIYGLSLEKMGLLEEAEVQLRKIDQRYSNYEERLILAKFLISRDKIEDAKGILEEVYSESQNMTRLNKKAYRLTIQEVEKTLNEI